MECLPLTIDHAHTVTPGNGCNKLPTSHCASVITPDYLDYLLPLMDAGSMAGFDRSFYGLEAATALLSFDSCGHCPSCRAGHPTDCEALEAHSLLGRTTPRPDRSCSSDYPHPEGMFDPVTWVDELELEDRKKIMGATLAQLVGVDSLAKAV